MGVGDFIIIALLLATVSVLVAGVVMMGMGGNANQRYGNKLMVARVSLQGLVLVMLVMMYSAGK